MYCSNFDEKYCATFGVSNVKDCNLIDKFLPTVSRQGEVFVANQLAFIISENVGLNEDSHGDKSFFCIVEKFQQSLSSR